MRTIRRQLSFPSPEYHRAAADKERNAAGYIHEADVSTNSELLSIGSFHAMTKNALSTLHTVDKSLDLVVKTMNVFDSYRISLSALSGNGAAPGIMGFARLLIDFVRKIDFNQLNQIISVVQNPMFMNLLTSGFQFDETDETNETDETKEASKDKKSSASSKKNQK